MSTDLLENCRRAALQACDRLEAVLRARRASTADYPVLQDGEAPFRYREICWRGEGRYDVMCDLSTAPWSEPSLKELPVLAPLLRCVVYKVGCGRCDYKGSLCQPGIFVCSDVFLGATTSYCSLVASSPGLALVRRACTLMEVTCSETMAVVRSQRPTMQIVLLGRADCNVGTSGIGEEDSEEHGLATESGGKHYTALLPTHCVNVFLPLVDLTEELGPTEFYPVCP